MALNIVDQAPYTILSGSSGGANPITGFDDAYGLSITAPATVTASQLNIQVSMSSAGTAGFLQSGGSPVLIKAGQSIVISPIPFRWLSIISTVGTEGQADIFVIGKVVLV